MAANRQFVPLRYTEAIFIVEDGTSCRMPSPRPGPLRYQLKLEQSEEPSLSIMKFQTPRTSGPLKRMNEAEF